MIDREKVIKGLECCHNKNMLPQHDQCPYHGFDEDCEANLHADALALLKKQEAVEPTLIREGRNKYYNDYVCPHCDNEVIYEQNYCSECGARFLWEEQTPVKDENSNCRPAYICDPEKNTICTKEGCEIFHFCRCTTNKEFAKTGENGKPIVAVRSDMEGEE